MPRYQFIYVSDHDQDHHQYMKSIVTITADNQVEARIKFKANERHWGAWIESVTEFKPKKEDSGWRSNAIDE